MSQPVRVGIDLTGMSGVPSGVRTRADAMIRALSALPDQVELHLLSSQPWVTQLASDLDLCMHRSPDPTIFGRLTGTSARVRGFVWQCDLEVVQIEAPPVPRNGGVPIVYSLHDLRGLDVPMHSLRSLSGLNQRFTVARSAKRASIVLALTQYMGRQFADRLAIDQSKVVVVPPGQPIRPPSGSDEAALQIPGPYVLCLGHLEARKNLEVMVAAAADPAWPEEVLLVLAGRDGGRQAELMAQANASPKPRCHFVGSVSETDKWDLIAGSLAVAIPSTIEGFGIVALEANVGGSPVLAADASALPEVVGTGDALLPWNSPSRWAEEVARLASSAEWRTTVWNKQTEWMARFSWATSASHLASVYRSLAPNGRPHV
jgi:glycosyltransferase involved in cell wall biosynthesis